jgi:hypothetical protein
MPNPPLFFDPEEENKALLELLRELGIEPSPLIAPGTYSPSMGQDFADTIKDAASLAYTLHIPKIGFILATIMSLAGQDGGLEKIESLCEICRLSYLGKRPPLEERSHYFWQPPTDFSH